MGLATGESAIVPEHFLCDGRQPGLDRASVAEGAAQLG